VGRKVGGESWSSTWLWNLEPEEGYSMSLEKGGELADSLVVKDVLKRNAGGNLKSKF
jgi:hypothetical protein